MPCAVELGKRKAAKAAEAKAKRERAKTRAQREALKTIPQLTKEAQRAFNAWVRLRDQGLPCVSCGSTEAGGSLTGGYWDCGHYRSVGACPELRFEPLNAHRQCKRCNQHQSGNVVEYRLRLIQRIGLAAVEWLEGPHEARRYSRDELRKIRDTYRAKARELRKAKTRRAA